MAGVAAAVAEQRALLLLCVAQVRKRLTEAGSAATRLGSWGAVHRPLLSGAPLVVALRARVQGAVCCCLSQPRDPQPLQIMVWLWEPGRADATAVDRTRNGALLASAACLAALAARPALWARMRLFVIPLMRVSMLAGHRMPLVRGPLGL